MKSILVHAWALHKNNNKYYLPYTHWIYLNEIVKYYDRVVLLSPVFRGSSETHLFQEIEFNNIEVYELPFSKNYLGAVRYFLSYLRAYQKISKNINVGYARYPVPFGWLQYFYFKKKRRIIHFVGDPIDTIVNNPNLSHVKKGLYKFFFKPEHNLYLEACNGADVYTNGSHLAEKLLKSGIQAKALVSSTLNDNDFYFDENKILGDTPKIIYVGYLRKAKGVETVIKSFGLLQKKFPNAILKIVGHGEMESELQNLVKDLNIDNVYFLGHIDNRNDLNNLLRSCDIFAFASLSEGSPRVILEAMANGLAIVSTPVGSLPSTFVADKEIIFSKYNNEIDFANRLIEISSNEVKFNNLRKNSYNRVKEYKIDNFLKQIFDN